MAGELSRQAIEAVDSGDMLADILGQPHQLADAVWRVESADVPRRDPTGGLVVCGMGGSAIGADLADAAIGTRATRPMRTVRDYSLEPWIAEDTLVLCSSYSGYTEETLACFEAATALGAPRVVLTTGGPLAEAARAEDVPVIGVPAGLQPRAAVIYMLVGALTCAERCGVAPSLEHELAAAEALLGELAVEWGPESSEDSLAKALARRLAPAVPVIYGAGATAAVAMRWKAQINENAKMPAFHSSLPEADHNELSAWDRAAPIAPFFGVFLEDAAGHPRLGRRMDLTARFAAEQAAGVERVASRGETALERVLSLVFLGDLVSLYLATLSSIDPTPVETIERFKREMGLVGPQD